VSGFTLAAPRRLVERQCRRRSCRRPGNFRPRGLLWPSRSRRRDDGALWRIRCVFPCRL
jgi:hypothetical protein